MDQLQLENMLEDMALAISQVAMSYGVTNVPNQRVLTVLYPLFEWAVTIKTSSDVIDDEEQYPI